LGSIERREQVQAQRENQNEKMKTYLSTVLAACIGLCAGFALCYLCLVIPLGEGKAKASVTQQEKRTISIDHEGSVYLAGERLDVSQLAPRLKALGGNQPVIIRAESTTDYRRGWNSWMTRGAYGPC
jgi:hypothetical protein